MGCAFCSYCARGNKRRIIAATCVDSQACQSSLAAVFTGWLKQVVYQTLWGRTIKLPCTNLCSDTADRGEIAKVGYLLCQSCYERSKRHTFKPPGPPMKRRLCLLPLRSRRAGVMPLTGTAMCTRPVNISKDCVRDMHRQRQQCMKQQSVCCFTANELMFLKACLTALVWKEGSLHRAIESEQGCVCRNRAVQQHSNKRRVGIVFALTRASGPPPDPSTKETAKSRDYRNVLVNSINTVYLCPGTATCLCWVWIG